MSFSQRFFPWAIVFFLLSTVLAISGARQALDPGLFHQLASYRQWVERGQLPQEHDFSFTPTQEKVVQNEWGASMVLYWTAIFSDGGVTGLIVLKYFLVFSICIGSVLYLRWRQTDWGVIGILALLPLYLVGWQAFVNIGSQLFSLLFLVGLFALLEAERRGRQWSLGIWCLLWVVWLNLDSGALWGGAIFVVYVVSRIIDVTAKTRSPLQAILQTKYLIIALVATVGLAGININGWSHLSYLWHLEMLNGSGAWDARPVWEAGLPAAQMMLLAALGIAIGAIAMRRSSTTFEPLVLTATAFIAIFQYRHGPLFAVSWFCLVPPMIQETKLGQHMQSAWQKRNPQIASVGLALGLVAIGFSINQRFWQLTLPTECSPSSTSQVCYPIGATDYLQKQAFSGNLIVPEQVGGYVLWSLFSEVKINLDARSLAAYQPEVVASHRKLFSAQSGWEKILDRSPSDAILVPRTAPLAQAMQKFEKRRRGWTPVYRDRSYVIYFRHQAAERMAKVDRSDEHINGNFPSPTPSTLVR